MSGATMADIRARLARITELHHALLDLIDGDADTETADLPDDECAGDPEPSLGEGGRWHDGKLEYDLELDTSDREQSLGWEVGARGSQAPRVCGSPDDREQDAGDMAEQEYGA